MHENESLNINYPKSLFTYRLFKLPVLQISYLGFVDLLL